MQSSKMDVSRKASQDFREVPRSTAQFWSPMCRIKRRIFWPTRSAPGELTPTN